jgi:hypothetical protein
MIVDTSAYLSTTVTVYVPGGVDGDVLIVTVKVKGGGLAGISMGNGTRERLVEQLAPAGRPVLQATPSPVQSAGFVSVIVVETEPPAATVTVLGLAPNPTR